MSDPFEAMNNVFRNSNSPLAEAVTFKLNSGSTAKSIYVNFFSEDAESLNGDVAVTRKEITAMCKSDDVSGADHDSYIIRNGITYYVVKCDVDDDNETVLYLSKNKIV